KMDRQADNGCLNPLFHGVADTHLLREQWDSLVRVSASLKNRTAPANVIVQRLANASSSDRVPGALPPLGRLVKTIFVLRYLSDPELRYRVQLQLNRGQAGANDFDAHCDLSRVTNRCYAEHEAFRHERANYEPMEHLLVVLTRRGWSV